MILRDIWRDGLAKGKAEGEAKGALAILSGQMEEKFGPLPSWVTARLRKATPTQTQLWSRKVLTAATLEAVVGRK